MCIYQSLAISILPQCNGVWIVVKQIWEGTAFRCYGMASRARRMYYRYYFHINISHLLFKLSIYSGCTTGTIFLSISVFSSFSCQYIHISELFFKIMPTTRYTNPLPPATPPFEKGSYYYALEIGLAWHGIELVSRLVYHIRLIHPKTTHVATVDADN